MKFFRALKKHVFDQKTFLLIFLSNPKWVFMFFEEKPPEKFCPDTDIEIRLTVQKIKTLGALIQKI